MEKILLITDSACDITLEIEKILAIKVINIPVSIKGESHFDRVSYTHDEFYNILNEVEEIPTTAHITPLVFCEEFHKAYEAGYNCLIYVSINADGSASFAASQKGRELLFSEYPELKDKLAIHLIPSYTFSIGYGIPVMRAAEKLSREQCSSKELIEFIEQELIKTDVCFSMYTLNFAKKSGRLSALSAFVGEMLGVRPLMSFRDGKSVVLSKVRGDKNVTQNIADYFFENKETDEYAIIIGENPECGEELERIIVERIGVKAAVIMKEGACIAINAGPKIVGLAFRNKNKTSK